MRRMKATAVVAAALLVVALLVAACGDDSEAGAPAPEPAANAAALQQDSAVAGRGISVSGVGTVTAEPDTASLALGVSVLANTAREARDQAAEAMNTLLDSLKGNGVAEKDIKTTQFSLNAEYEYTAGRPRLTGYRLVNTVSVTVRDLDRVPEVIDEAVDAVGDPLQVSGVSFFVDDPTVLLSEARAQAMSDAKAKAQQLAELGDVALGRPVSISETTSGGPTPIFFDAARAAEAPSTPIQPGQLEVTVTVQVTYAIQ